MGEPYFNSYANPQNPMSSETVNRVLNRNGYKDILTAHGIRSIVRTYLAKQNVERNTAEAVLSHKIKDRLERTYNRSDYFEERIPVMQNVGGLRFQMWLALCHIVFNFILNVKCASSIWNDFLALWQL